RFTTTGTSIASGRDTARESRHSQSYSEFLQPSMCTPGLAAPSTCHDTVWGSAAPNKRLKLPGGDRSKGSGVLCANAHELSFNYTAPGGRVTRILSAIR